MRLDQWLWAVRACKTRSLAVTELRAGRVRVNGNVVKPAHAVRPGEIVTVRIGILCRTLRVIDSPRSKVGAPQVALYAEDLTPEAEYTRAREESRLRATQRPTGAGRPTKRERRALDTFEAPWDSGAD